LLTEFHFLRPLWLLAIPLVWWLVFRLLGKWWSTANWEKIVEPHLLQFLATTPATQKTSLLPWIMCFTGTLLLLALAGPVMGKSTTTAAAKITGKSTCFGPVFFDAGDRYKTDADR
jgi:Ca-activated chloride channel family protein